MLSMVLLKFEMIKAVSLNCVKFNNYFNSSQPILAYGTITLKRTI